MGKRAVCGEIRRFLRKLPGGELMWLQMDSSIHRGDPEQERLARRWRRLIREEWARRDALKAEAE